MKTATLSASTLSDPDSLFISLTTDMLLNAILKSREGQGFGNPWGVMGRGLSGMGGGQETLIRRPPWVHSDAAGSVQLGLAQLATLATA